MPENRSIVIQGEAFSCPQPYSAGHVLTEAESRALNQVFSENIRNNLAGKVKEAKEKGNLQEVLPTLTEYAANYSFALPGQTERRSVDPYEREARSIARESIKAHLAAKGRKIKDVDAEKLEAKIDELAAREDILKLARKRVNEKKKVVELTVEGLDSSAPTEAAA
jgi:peptidoglycan/xylan/chitin deacetylase (PgdA/CDA1 family)